MNTKRTALYRHYDDLDVLLYVGISDGIARRTREHAVFNVVGASPGFQQRRSEYLKRRAGRVMPVAAIATMPEDPEAVVLRFVLDNPGCSRSEIERGTGLSYAAALTASDRLRRQGALSVQTGPRGSWRHHALGVAS